MHQKVAMNTYTKYTIMVTLVLVLGLIAYFLGGSEQDNAALKERTVEAISWEKTYDSKSKHPYGTFFIRSIFENGLEGHSVHDINVSVQSYFDSTDIQIKLDNVTYFFVGKSLNLYDDEVDSLLRFVEKGNTMFVAAEFLPNHLLKEIFYNYNDYNYFGYTNDSSISLSFQDARFTNEYDIVNEVKGKSKTKRWYNINYGIEYGYNGRTIGKSGYRPCYVEFEYGDGKILIHTIPQVFTNKYLSSESGKEYVETVLSYFSKSAILFDNYTHYAYDDGTMDIDQPENDFSGNSGRRLNDYNTLDFLLSNVALRWGYFIILVGVLLFVIFTGKRQQKIMPTVSSNDNSSLEFTETIARLYLKQNQHNKLIVHMENIFKNKIKSRYYIAYSEEEAYVRRIAQKSGVEKSEIQDILNLFKGGANLTSVSDEYLVNLYKKLNNFYKKSK